jgi:hypothetical protein
LGAEGAVAEASEVVTRHQNLDFVAFRYARAEVALGVPGNRTAILSRTQLDRLAIGTKHRLQIGHSEVQQATRSLRCRYDFELHAAIKDVAFGRDSSEEIKCEDVRLITSELPRTYEKLAEWVDRHRELLLPHSAFRPGKDDASSGKMIALHLVRELPGKGCHISNGEDTEPNGLYLEGFGQLYFGELLVTPRYRRFAAIRFVLGCDGGGGGSAGDTGNGGGNDSDD